MLQEHQSDFDSNLLAQPNLIQFHILGEGEQQIDPEKALFQNKYDMLDSYNKVLATGHIDKSNRSGGARDSSQQASEMRSNTEQDSPNRLRKIQIKDSEQDVPTPHKLVDLSEVLDVNASSGANEYRSKVSQSKVVSSGLSS